MLSERLQILIDAERLSRIRHAAGERGVSVAQVIRDAIDQAFPVQSPEKRRAAEVILGATPMPVPAPAQLREQLEQIRTHGR
ncbi:MAG: CopG family transcriptional regulator [Actinomycetota bacterium]